MTEAALALVAGYGGWLLFVITLLSCLALPVPSSLAMLAGGAFVAAGDMTRAETLLPALVGALLGDQLGYWLGLRGGGVIARAQRSPQRAALIARARVYARRRGVAAVFLTRWLFSPLGPWVNFIAGGIGMGWARFTLGSALGETVWVALYVGLGFAFAENILAVADLAGNLSGLLAALAVMLVTARQLRRRRRGSGERTAGSA